MSDKIENTLVVNNGHQNKEIIINTTELENKTKKISNSYKKIIYHLYKFLSKNSIYESASFNAKIMVFNSELSFREIIKIFILEGINAAIIYDTELNNFIGSITLRDIMLLYRFIFHKMKYYDEKTNFSNFLQDIFSNKDNASSNNIIENKNFKYFDVNIYNYLSNITYYDYLDAVKNNFKENIYNNIYSVSLDVNLFYGINVIYNKSSHQILIENVIKDNKNTKNKQDEIIKKINKKKLKQDLKNKEETEKSDEKTDATKKEYKNENIEEEFENIKKEEKVDPVKNYTGFISYQSVFNFLINNYYNFDMSEFSLTLKELIILQNQKIIQEIIINTDKKNLKENQIICENINEKVYKIFDDYSLYNSEIIPIFSENNNSLEGFVFPEDFLFFISNYESKETLNCGLFLKEIYKDIDETKPYGVNKISFIEINDKNEKLTVKELIEELNCSISKKIILYTKKNATDIEKLYIISPKTIFMSIIDIMVLKIR